MRAVHFLCDFDITPRDNQNITYAYYAGNLAEIDDDWADLAVATGAAVFVEPPADPAPAPDESHGG